MDVPNLYLPRANGENVPVFGSARGGAVFIHFMKGFDLKARELRADLFLGMKCHICIDGP